MVIDVSAMNLGTRKLGQSSTPRCRNVKKLLLDILITLYLGSRRYLTVIVTNDDVAERRCRKKLSQPVKGSQCDRLVICRPQELNV